MLFCERYEVWGNGEYEGDMKFNYLWCYMEFRGLRRQPVSLSHILYYLGEICGMDKRKMAIRDAVNDDTIVYDDAVLYDLEYGNEVI